jgi:NAD(P)-dependent dehydrogenase (short-subunit alcohol dehydrogenase family)
VVTGRRCVHCLSQTAFGRVGVPDDIGGVVAFLCSEEGRWVNAQRLEASDGMFL